MLAEYKNYIIKQAEEMAEELIANGITIIAHPTEKVGAE